MKNIKINGLSLILILGIASVALTAQAERDSSRDQFRHPVETIDFFGLTPEMNVVEITPGGGWYTELLADYITGTLFAAHFNPKSKGEYFRNSRARFEKKLLANPQLYGNVELHTFDISINLLTTPANSADALVTFRNVHNWLRSNNEAVAFELFYKTLKAGGILGVVEHRAAYGTDRETMLTSGYMTQEYVIDLAERAGFVLEASTEINANPKDSADHPKGVWTLPPSLRLGAVDRDKYLAIGESDRMTLRFRKPKL
ncbi:methyltransferase [SAR92 clade bacterium H921]|nr:methyltransferase [SAR92 clade bacterium H921]